MEVKCLLYCNPAPDASDREGTSVINEILKEAREFVHRKPGLSNQCPKSSFGQFFMVRNGEASVRWFDVSKNDVATVLLIEFVSRLSECHDCLAAGTTGSFIRRQPQ